MPPTDDEQRLGQSAAHASSNHSEEDKEGRNILSTIRTFLIYLYGVATFVGFAYAYAYYGQFGIEFLNFATVVDFIFASLANIGTLPTIIPLVILAFVVLTLLLGLLAFLVGVSTKDLVKSVVNLVLRFAWAMAARAAHIILSVVVFIVSVGEFVWSSWVSLGRRTLAAFSKYRANRAEYRRQRRQSRRGRGTAAGELPAEEEERPRKVTFRQTFASLAGEYAVSSGRRESHKTRDWLEKTRGWPEKTRGWLESARKGGEERRKGVRANWSRSWCLGKKHVRRSYRRIPKSRPWILSICALFFVIATATAAGVGVADARCVLKDEKNCRFEVAKPSTYSSYFVSWLRASIPFVQTGSKEQFVVNEFIVPLANLASMRSVPDLDCHCVEGGSKKVEGTGCIDCMGRDYSCPRKYYRVDVRQGVGDDTVIALPGCLVYVGAVEHAHFLAQIGGKPLPEDLCGGSDAIGPPEDGDPPKNGKPPWGDAVVRHTYHHHIHRSGSGESNPPGAFDRACSYEFVATVGPFLEGSVRFDEAGQSCLDGRMQRNFEDLSEAVVSQLGGAKVKEMLLVGHVDSRPIETDEFGSNFALAQARAERAYGKLKDEEWAKGAHVVRLPAGPRDAGQPPNDCDRNVEVHVCVVRNPEVVRQRMVGRRSEQ